MSEQQALRDSAATLRQQLKALQRMVRGAVQIAADLEERLEAIAQPEEAQHDDPELDWRADGLQARVAPYIGTVGTIFD